MYRMVPIGRHLLNRMQGSLENKVVLVIDFPRLNFYRGNHISVHFVSDWNIPLDCNAFGSM